MFSTKYDEETKVWSGRDTVPIYNPTVSLAQVLLSTMRNFDHKIAQVYIKFNERNQHCEIFKVTYDSYRMTVKSAPR